MYSPHLDDMRMEPSAGGGVGRGRSNKGLMCCGSTGAVRAVEEWPFLLPSTPKSATR